VLALLCVVDDALHACWRRSVRNEDVYIPMNSWRAPVAPLAPGGSTRSTRSSLLPGLGSGPFGSTSRDYLGAKAVCNTFPFSEATLGRSGAAQSMHTVVGGVDRSAC
jgi:hypothetical protein